jgi:hypothetical protein
MKFDIQAFFDYAQIIDAPCSDTRPINYNGIPTWAIHPLTNAWDHCICPVCDYVEYRIFLPQHIITHNYVEPLLLRVLRLLA